ncbi:MAG: hypothetical protein K5787_15415, partial [Lentisphaeria bacterium]|nr:hypothetical protein [Lentisphaeria bacterium]
PSFGRLPSGKRLERIRQSPNYVDGEFRYPVKTEVMTSRRLPDGSRPNDGVCRNTQPARRNANGKMKMISILRFLKSLRFILHHSQDNG